MSQLENNVKSESVLDQPKSDLDSKVWEKTENGEYSLTNEAKTKIYLIIKWAVDHLGVNNYGVNIIGSITSNQYSEDSDIDLHFNSKEIPDDKQDEVNKMLRDEFEIYKQENENDVMVGNHPIEVYFQSNPYQDMMSVGCYDVINEKWLVGPEKKDLDFDPYSEYYDEDMKYVQDVIDDIRNIILEAFESATVIRNAKDEKFKQFEMQHLKDKIGRAAKIFTDAREFRKVSSTPENREQALSNRYSKKWKIADSAFKLLDKFGYLGILRTMTQCHEKEVLGQISDEQIVSEIINSVSDNFQKNQNLNEDELSQFSDLQEESIKDVVKYAMLIGSLAIPFSSVADNSKDNDSVPKQEMRILSEQYGGMSYANNVNMLAWTLWTEARGEYKKFGIKSLNAVASVILNRAGKDPDRFVKVISKPFAFSWWNDYEDGWTDSDYIPHNPTEEELKNTDNEKIWTICNEMATKMMDGKFKGTIGNYNSYLNKNTAGDKAKNSWGRKCNYRIGNHWFGYLPENDGFRNKKDNYKFYVIKSGDTLSKIASKFKTTTQNILAKNPNISNANKIAIGTKLKI